MKEYLNWFLGFQATVVRQAMSDLKPCLEHRCVCSCVLRIFLLLHCAPCKAAHTFALYGEHLHGIVSLQPWVLTSQLQSSPRTTVVPKVAEVLATATALALATPAATPVWNSSVSSTRNTMNREPARLPKKLKNLPWHVHAADT